MLLSIKVIHRNHTNNHADLMKITDFMVVLFRLYPIINLYLIIYMFSKIY